MADDDALSGARARDRRAPAAADAIAFAGGVGIAFGVLLLTIDFAAHGHGRPPGVALFAVLLAAGYLALAILPHEMHAAAVTVIVTAVPGALGWWILPHAHRFADVRPFLILVIVAWGVCWLAPRTRGRTIFVAAALIVLWMWMLGEAAGTDAYSAAPVPSPPAHTMFSLSAFRADSCASNPSSTSFGRCADQGGFANPSQFGGGLAPEAGAVLNAGTHDKSLEIGLVSSVFGVAYLGALAALDRQRRRGLGTALVVPAFLALFTGTEALGNASHHAWVGGLLTFVAGIAFAMVGEVGGRRFTTWAGGVLAAFGVYTFATDVANLDRSFSGVHVRLVRPALVAIGFGAGLVALAWVTAAARSRDLGAARSKPPFEP